MIEIDEVICVTLGTHRSFRDWCPDCGADTLMLMPQEAAAIARVSVREVNRSIEAGQVHFLETAEGLLLVCMNSLSGRQTSSSLVRFAGIDQK